MKLRVGIDVGGTFTDVTVFDEGSGEVVAIKKYSSNSAEPMKVMDEICADIAKEFDAGTVSLILHGSTAALNTLLEDKGVRAGLLTTKGFRDVYEIGRQWRGEDVFNLYAPAPKMLLTRDCIYEVRERLDYRGDIIEPIQLDDVRKAAEALKAANVKAIAVAFLFSYANAAHELAAAEIIREVAPDIYVSLSSNVNPEWREYERTASTVANAYIGPPTAKYLQDLEALSLKYFPNARVLMMKSDGGAASSAMLWETPIQTVMSGPVAGVIGSRRLGDIKGIENLISFDVGGTSTDMAVIPGAPLQKSELRIGRHPIRTSAVDIDTIGAGGGSLASIQLGGVLKVGPESAGAWPGPACYNRGGTKATLTDALVVLGHLNPVALLEGTMPIDAAKSTKAVQSSVSSELRMTDTEAAWGILTVLCTNVMVAMRTITVERGYDPREFTLVPFGGMGPTIAGKVAAELGIERILVPQAPGIFSASGMLVSDIKQESSVTRLTPLDSADQAALEAIYDELKASAKRGLLKENVAPEDIKLLRYAGMRYSGQSYEVLVALDDHSLSNLDNIKQRFHDAHHRRYGHMAQTQALEIVNYKVVALGEFPKPAPQRHPSGKDGKRIEPEGRRPCYFDGTTALETPVYYRRNLMPDFEVSGPAIIEEMTSTTIIYPNQSARVDEYLNIEMTLPPMT